MCEVLDKWKQRGKEEGLREGLVNIIQKKIEKGKSIEEIADALELSVEEVENLAKTFLAQNA